MFYWLRRFLSYPLVAVLYIRHKLYDYGIFKSYEARVPTICVGNLAVGGTGKSPIVAALLENFIAPRGAVVLSRGYGRTTRGFRVVRLSSLASEVGDEPLQLKLRIPESRIAVCEDRVLGSERLLEEFPDCKWIVLDDAFQHRRLLSTVNLLLTRYDRPFSRDKLFPAGKLRDLRSQVKRADAIIVTNIPSTVTEEECQKLAEALRVYEGQAVLFATIRYEMPRTLSGEEIDTSTLVGAVYAVAGIANPRPFFRYVATKWRVAEYLTYSDHHRFSSRDLAFFEKIAEHGGWLIMTEKDATRIREKVVKESILQSRILYIPIQIVWLWGSESKMKGVLAHVLEAN